MDYIISILDNPAIVRLLCVVAAAYLAKVGIDAWAKWKGPLLVLAFLSFATPSQAIWLSVRNDSNATFNFYVVRVDTAAIEWSSASVGSKATVVSPQLSNATLLEVYNSDAELVGAFFGGDEVVQSVYSTGERFGMATSASLPKDDYITVALLAMILGVCLAGILFSRVKLGV